MKLVAATLAVGLLTAWPQAASADCADPSDCVCSLTGAVLLVEGTALGQGNLRIDRVVIRRLDTEDAGILDAPISDAAEFDAGIGLSARPMSIDGSPFTVPDHQVGAVIFVEGHTVAKAGTRWLVGMYSHSTFAVPLDSNGLFGCPNARERIAPDEIAAIPPGISNCQTWAQQNLTYVPCDDQDGGCSYGGQPRRPPLAPLVFCLLTVALLHRRGAFPGKRADRPWVFSRWD